MRPTLLVLAAGMGSRYGGLKQTDPVGPGSELIIDYSIYDAIKAGFGKVVFVIRSSFEQTFKEKYGGVYEKNTQVSYAYQELNGCVGSFIVPQQRQKPWGTGHAVLVARDVIEGPFAVINADDYYGPRAFKFMAKYLVETASSESQYCMTGFPLRNTVSDHGSVCRGICRVDEQMLLRNVSEYTGIERKGDGITSIDEHGKQQDLTGDEIVSMNMWGFKPSIFDFLQSQFDGFLKAYGNEPKSEFFIPAAVDSLLQDGLVKVKVLETGENWFGVTYRQDKIEAQQSIKKLIQNGIYPERLWS